ncbi:MAG TPA: replication-associated recombination protein A [Candidatus Acidoferrales bacterium]|nr:replication-associated recombination protein A [Candidatus Acidoferrales bacterium]
MSEQAELFGSTPRGAGGQRREDHAENAPLATRMRPRTLDEFVGQEHVLGEGSVLRRALDAGEVPSMILWGPPGTGKTTVAMLVSTLTDAAFEPVSAATAGVAELRAVVERARQRARVGQRTVLFIDEIHRFNKTQQDAVLPHVESGLVTLLGATTENPSFEVNAALLSRSRVVRLEALADSDIDQLLDRALVDAERGLGRNQVTLEDSARSRLLSLSGGDARIALNALELAVHATLDSSGAATVTAADIEGALQQPALLYDRAGDQHYWLISAFIKSLRGSDPDAAVYWMARMLEAGEDPLFVARRMVILAAEDVGLADPQALTVAVAAQQAAHFVGMPEGFLPLTEAALYLATAPKSNSAMTAYTSALADVRETLHQPVPLHLRNAVTGLDRSMGFGSGYRYAHAYKDGIVEQQHLPDSLAGHRYYEPSEQGAEAAVAERLRAIRAELAARNQSNTS